MNLENTKNQEVEEFSSETKRQYHYIENLRKWHDKKKAELGRPLTACVQCFGCQMNARDAEKITGIL